MCNVTVQSPATKLRYRFLGCHHEGGSSVKKNEQPEFSAKWWKSSQPKGLKSAGRLEDALKDYEAIKKKLDASGEADVVKTARDALGTVETAVDAVTTEAGKDKKNPEMALTIDALKKFDRLYPAERSWIEDHAEQDDDSIFADPDAYHDYLIAAMKKLRSGGQMNFGFVLGKKAEDHRLAVHRSKGSKALANTLVKETGLHAMTFGTAMADENRAGMLVLLLEGRQLPGMKKKGERMLKKFKPLPFIKLSVMADGQELEDIADPDDTDTDTDEPDLANAADGNAAAFTALRAGWVGARQKIDTDIEKLHAAMSAVYQGRGVAGDLEKAFRTQTGRVLNSLDASLADKLAELANAGNSSQHATLIAEARQIAQRYTAYVANEPMIAALDANPFVSIAIQDTITSSLSELTKALA